MTGKHKLQTSEIITLNQNGNENSQSLEVNLVWFGIQLFTMLAMLAGSGTESWGDIFTWTQN